MDGTFTITLKVIDPSTSQKIGEASASALIASAPAGDPEITTITPDSAIAEATIAIHGRNFGSSQASGWVSMSYIDSLSVAVDTTCQDYVDIQISGMKLNKFDHELVLFSATTAEAKECVSYLKYWSWYMHYEGYDTLAFCGISVYR
jgi:hypothetical protein